MSHSDFDGLAELRRLRALPDAAAPLESFVRAQAGRPTFIDWLNDPDSDAADVLASLAGADAAGVALGGLSAQRQSLADWYREAGRAVAAAGRFYRESRAALLLQVAQEAQSIDPTAVDYIRHRTRLPDLYDRAHELLFLHAFATGGATAQGRAQAVARAVESPAWMTASERLSVLAQRQGPVLIEILAEAAAIARQDQDYLLAAIEALTGLRDTGDPADMVARARAWYRTHRDALVLDPTALYPAPPGSPVFRVR